MPADSYDYKGTHFRDPPTNLNAERSLLGLIMQDGTLLNRIEAELGEKLQAQDFASVKNRCIFEAILRRAATSDNFEPTLIIGDLERESRLEEAGGAHYVITLLSDLDALPAAIAEYAQLILETSKRRKLILVAEHIEKICYQPEGLSVDELYDKAQGLVFNLAEDNARQNQGPQDMLTVAQHVIEQLNDDLAHQIKLRGVSTGFTRLDEMLSGLRGQSLYIIAARPGVGKTSFAMNIVENVVTNLEVTKPALVFSLEMPSSQIALRMLSTFGRISTDDLSLGRASVNQWHDIIRKIRLLTYEDEARNFHSKLYIDDDAELTPLELRSRARKIYEENKGLSVIMVDYLQLMHSQGRAENRSLEVGEISRSLKALAKELDVPILALSQLNREVEGRRDHRPVNSDLRESGSLEQDADVILFIDRNVKSRKKEDESYVLDDNKATLIVSKNRHGGTGDIPLLFQGAYTAFYDAQSPDADTELPPLPEYGG